MKRFKTRLFSTVVAMALLLPVIPAPGAQAATTHDVTSYGAHGGDTADDLTAIQAAVDAASSGDTVYFPAGTYYVSGIVQAKSGIVLEGAGRDTTTIKYNATTEGYIFSLNNTNDVEVTGFTLDGNSNNYATGLIWGEPGSGHYVHHNRFKDLTKPDGFAPFGILFSATDDVVISDNEFSNMGVNSTWGGAIRVGWDSHGATIERNTIADTGRGGIFLNDGCSNAVVRGNTLTGSGLHEHGLSIELHTDCDYSVIEDNNVDHWISAVRSAYIAVRDNVVHTTDGTVQGMGLEVMVDHGVTTGNLVDGGQQVGMQQSPGTGYQFWGYNTVKNMVMWGMQLQGEGTGQVEQFQYFYKNRFENTRNDHPAAAYPGYDGNAIRIHGNSQNLTFDSNEIINNGRKGIEITTAGGTDRLSFINNVITGNVEASIDQYPASASHLEWSWNTVSGNGTDTQLTSRGFSNPKPTASFTAPSSVQLGQAVTFLNASTDNGSIVENLWDFGAGVPNTDVSPTYTYEEPGTYRVTLVVWDNEGRASLKEHTITVNAGPPDTQAPSAPSGLSSPAKTGTTVDLSWNAASDNVGVYGYRIYVNGLLEDSTTDTSYTVDGLNPSTAYSFTVTAYDAASNESSASNTLNVTTDAPDMQAPSAPSGLTSPAKTDTSVDLSWSPASDNVGVTGYEVYVNGVLEDTTSGTAFTVSGLNPNTAYSFTVRAYDAANNISAASSALNVTTEEPATNWVHCAGENNQCSFTGTKEVRFGANGSYAYGTFTDGVMCGVHIFGDPAPGYYKTCDVGEEASPGGDSQAPTAPTNLTAPANTSTSVDLSWSAASDNVAVTGYNVYVDGVLEDSTSGTTYTVSGLTASTAYDFTVKAYDAANNLSPASNTVTVTTGSSGSANWVHCAGENNQCSFTGTKEVRYGANGNYAYGTFTDGVMCGNHIFGDPAPGSYKTCDVNEGSLSSLPEEAPAALLHTAAVELVGMKEDEL